MRKFLLLTIIIVLAGCKTSDIAITPAGYFNVGDKEIYQDSDWNLEFFDNCGMPNHSSAQWMTEGKETFLRFTLRKGDFSCKNDPFRTPRKERAEMKQTTELSRNVNYTLTYKVRIVKGFTYFDESFMQILQSHSTNCHGQPYFKMLFDNGLFRWSHLRIRHIIGRWVNVKMHFNVPKTYSIYLDGKPIVREGVYWWRRKCGLPFLKFGIYREEVPNLPGEQVSIVDFDKINLVEGKK